jgi:hypothetical protein
MEFLFSREQHKHYRSFVGRDTGPEIRLYSRFRMHRYFRSDTGDMDSKSFPYPDKYFHPTCNL